MKLAIYRKVATYFFFHPAQADGYIVENLPERSRQLRGLLTRSRFVTFLTTMARADMRKAARIQAKF